MKWSLKLGRFAGIDVYLHVTFLIVVGIIGLSYWYARGTIGAAVEGMGFFLALFLCVLLHEFGHALMARRFGIATEDITLLPIGGIARLDHMPEKPIQEILVALAGPAVNVVIALLLGVYVLAGDAFPNLSAMHLGKASFVANLMVVNVWLVVFNMIPAFPMDGGRVLRAFLAFFMDHVRATRIAATIGQGIAVVFAVVGLFTPHNMLVLIALFVWIGASQEAGMSEMKSILSGARVRQAMLTEFHALAPSDSLRRVTQLVMAGSQQDFPVVEDGEFRGLLSRVGLMKALERDGLDGRVADAMARDCPRLDADAELDVVLPSIRSSRCSALPVFADGRLIGILNMENVAELVMIRAALGNERVGARA